MTVELTDLAAAIRWFHGAWTDRETLLPKKLHYTNVVQEADFLGPPKRTAAFDRHLDAEAHDVTVIRENRRCGHLRLTGEDVFRCPDCLGSGWYEARRAYYRDPLGSALDSLRRHPGSWPRGMLPPYRLIAELANRGYDLCATAYVLVVREDVLAEYALIAFRRLARRFREAPPTRIGWTEKSDAQRAAETAA